MIESHKKFILTAQEFSKGGVPNTASKSDVTLVLGAPRSGTSLMQMVLCSAKNANPYIAEAVPLKEMVVSLYSTEDHTKKYPKDYFKNLKSNAKFGEAILKKYMEQFIVNHGTEKLVIKSPALTPYLPFLDRVSDGSYNIILMVRNPFQVLSSILRWRDKVEKDDKKFIFSNINVQDIGKYIVYHYGMLTELNPEIENRMFFCKFENFIQNSQQIENQLEGWLGLKDISFSGNAKVKDLNKTEQAPKSYTALFGEDISSAPLTRAFHPEVIAHKSDLDEVFYSYNLAFGYPTETCGALSNYDLIPSQLNLNNSIQTLSNVNAKKMALEKVAILERENNIIVKKLGKSESQQAIIKCRNLALMDSIKKGKIQQDILKEKIETSKLAVKKHQIN